MAEVRHVTFHPTMTMSLAEILTQQERQGWALQRVVWWSAFEAVAVFERAHPDRTEGRESYDPD